MIKNLTLLEETSKIEDLLDVSTISDSFGDRINSVPSQSIIALVGTFGSGKSTMLHQISKSEQDNKTWIEFDAWKYPNRSNLWEGFVLDLAEQVGESGNVLKQIEGKTAKGAAVDIATDVVTLISEKLSGINVLDKFTEFFKKSPATRVFELQRILKGIIESQEKDMVIVVEDIDRSGDAGVYFLETLKQFLRSFEIEKKIVVVVPMANHNYLKNIDSYLKCVDYFDFFGLEEIKLDNFVLQTFDEKLFEGEKRNGRGQIAWSGGTRKSQTISFLESLFREFPKMNLRLLKLILRKANIVFNKMEKDGHEPDFRVVLCIEASKYFNKSDEIEETYYDEFKRNKLTDTTSVFTAFLYSMLGNSSSLYRTNYSDGKEVVELQVSNGPFKFVERTGGDIKQFPSEPWTYTSYDDDSAGFGVASVYLKY